MQKIKKIIRHVPVLTIMGLILYLYFDATYTGNRDMFGLLNDSRFIHLFLVFPFLVVFDFVRISKAWSKPKTVTNVSAENNKFGHITLFLFWLLVFSLSRFFGVHYISNSFAHTYKVGPIITLNLFAPFIFLALLLMSGDKAESRTVQIKKVCIFTLIYILYSIIF